MTNEELFEKIDKRLLLEREETRRLIDQSFILEREETRRLIDQSLTAEREETRKIVQEETEPIKKEIQLLHKSSRKTNKILTMVAKFYDNETANLRKRVSNIEKHLGLSDPTRLI